MILIEKRWSSSVCGCRSFLGADISSDHNLVFKQFPEQIQEVTGHQNESPKIQHKQADQ